MRRLIYVLIATSVLALSSCSTKQHLITGEPLVYRIAPSTGEILDRDTLAPNDANMVTPHKGEIITLVLNNVFIKYLQDIGSPHVLVYAQVFDDGTDNPDTAITKVLYNERNSPQGVNLCLADRVLYGPTPFKGFPLRVKLCIVELDKERKQLASQIIDAVGATASAARPEAAPAVGVAVKIAQFLNALDEDDFELRFDLTLYPIGSIGRSSTGDAALDRIGEPRQRKGADVTMVTPLRTGMYAVMKRELQERFHDRAKTEVPEPSAFDVDYSQRYFLSGYAGLRGQIYEVNEVLRYEGGYLYRVITTIKDVSPAQEKEQGQAENTAKAGEEENEVSSALVRPRSGPNRGMDVVLTRGIRERFMDRTYVVLSVVPGLPLGLDSEALKAASSRDIGQLTKLLDNPSDVSLRERIGPEVDAIAASLKTTLEQRRIAEQAARRVGRDPSFRTSPEYALFWIQQIDPLTAGADTRNAEAKNAAVLEMLADIVMNLPILSPANSAQMAALRSLDTSDLDAVENKPGLFQLNDQGKTKLKG